MSGTVHRCPNCGRLVVFESSTCLCICGKFLMIIDSNRPGIVKVVK